jgi:hypothetical protein
MLRGRFSERCCGSDYLRSDLKRKIAKKPYAAPQVGNRWGGSVSAMIEFGFIEPFAYDDPETGDRIAISVSDFYTKLSVNGREYFFVRETGTFDGAANVKRSGPILVYAAE